MGTETETETMYDVFEVPTVPGVRCLAVTEQSVFERLGEGPTLMDRLRMDLNRIPAGEKGAVNSLILSGLPIHPDWLEGLEEGWEGVTTVNLARTLLTPNVDEDRCLARVSKLFRNAASVDLSGNQITGRGTGLMQVFLLPKLLTVDLSRTLVVRETVNELRAAAGNKVTVVHEWL